MLIDCESKRAGLSGIGFYMFSGIWSTW